MTTIGIDLGWRHCRVVVFNELSELLLIHDSSRGILSADAPSETLPVIARKAADGEPVLVGEDALFGLLYTDAWKVEHAFDAEGKSSSKPLTALLDKLQKDLEAAGYPPAESQPKIRVTADDSILKSLALQNAVQELRWNNVKSVTRANAARVYGHFMYREISRDGDDGQTFDDTLVVDFGFKSLLITRYERPGAITVHDVSSSLELEEDEAYRNNARKVPGRHDPLVEDAFGSWARIISVNMHTAAHGQFGSIDRRDIYRYFDQWWRQSVRADRRNRKTSPPREAPFSFSVEVNPSGQPFLGLDPDAIFRLISQKIESGVKNAIRTSPATEQGFGERAKVILIGQYSDVPEIVDELVPTVRTQFCGQLQGQGRMSRNTDAIRLPASGLAAGAAKAPDGVCEPLKLGTSNARESTNE